MKNFSVNVYDLNFPKGRESPSASQKIIINTAFKRHF